MGAIATNRQRSLARGHGRRPAFVWKCEEVLLLLSSRIVCGVVSTLVHAGSEEILLLFNLSGTSLIFGPCIRGIGGAAGRTARKRWLRLRLLGRSSRCRRLGRRPRRRLGSRSRRLISCCSFSRAPGRARG